MAVALSAAVSCKISAFGFYLPPFGDIDTHFEKGRSILMWQPIILSKRPGTFGRLRTLFAAGLVSLLLGSGCSSKSTTTCINENSEDPACIKAREVKGTSSDPDPEPEPKPEPTSTPTPDTNPPQFESGLALTNAATNKAIGWSERTAATELVTVASFTGSPAVVYKLMNSGSACDATTTDFSSSLPKASDITEDGRYMVCAKASNDYGTAYRTTSADIVRWVDNLYFGGTFTSVSLGSGGAQGTANYIARWSTKTNLWYPISGGPDNGVTAMTRGSDGSLYVTTKTSPKLWKYDGKNWTSTTIPGVAHSIAANSTKVALGFPTSVRCDLSGGGTAFGLCLYDLVTGAIKSAATTAAEALEPLSYGGPNLPDSTPSGGIGTVIASGEDFIFGGYFDTIVNGATRRNLGATKANGIHQKMSDDNLGVALRTILIKGNKLYFAGDGPIAALLPGAAPKINRCDYDSTNLTISNCASIVTNGMKESNQTGDDYRVTKLFFVNETLYAVGNMSFDDGAASYFGEGIAKWDGTTWSAVNIPDQEASPIFVDGGQHPSGDAYAIQSTPIDMDSGVRPGKLWSLHDGTWTQVGSQDFPNSGEIAAIPYVLVLPPNE